MRELEALICILLRLPEESCEGFDDEEGNYPASIFEEMEPYLGKVELLFGNTILSGLQGRRRKIYEKGSK